jgi:hypothetical protein
MQEMFRMFLLYQFKFHDIKPLLDTQTILKERAFIRFLEQKEAVEGLMRQKEEPKIEIRKTKEKIEQKPGEKAKREELETYVISYYNPTSKKYETLEATQRIVMDDILRKKIEEAAGAQTAYHLYSFIATPIITKEVDPYILKEILENREYGTPPQSGTAPAVKMLIRESEPAKIEEAKSALVEAIKRKESAEKKIGEEIMIMEEVIKEIKKGGDIRQTLRQLGPLTRAKFLAAIRKKGISKAVLLLLLEKDVEFLKSVKKKLETLTVDGLLELIRAMRILQRRK